MNDSLYRSEEIKTSSKKAPAKKNQSDDEFGSGSENGDESIEIAPRNTSSRARAMPRYVDLSVS